MKIIFSLLFCLISFSNAYSQQKIFEVNPEASAKNNYKNSSKEIFSEEANSSVPMLNEEKWSNDFAVPGITGVVYVTATDGVNLYAGGNFKVAGSAVANNIAKWDGQRWSSIGEGSENGVDFTVHAIVFQQGKLFVGGMFKKAGTVNVNGVAFWDGAKWNALGSDSTNGVRRTFVMETDTIEGAGFCYSLYANNNELYVGGFFDLVGETFANGVAAWNINTGEWNNLKGGLASDLQSDPVYAYCFEAFGEEVFVGGKFSSAGGTRAVNIARWNGSEWSAAGDADAWVFDFEKDINGMLHAGGYFTNIGGVNTGGVAKWNGTGWEALGNVKFPSGTIKVLKAHNNHLFAGGFFDSVGTANASGFAMWDGATWSVPGLLGKAVNEFFKGSVRGIEVIGGKTYVAGDFTTAGDLYLNNVAEWDFNTADWKMLDEGIPYNGIHDGEIQVLAAAADAIYAGGTFSVAGGAYARSIAKWNGTSWQSLGTDYNNGIRGTVYTVDIDGNDVYAGGHFGSAGTTEAYHIAKWDGVNWSRIGIGVGGVSGATVYAVKKVGDYLYVGGYFTVVGDDENYALPANSIARFNLVSQRWETLGQGIEYVKGIPGIVYALEVDGDKIYVGGRFLSVDDQYYSNFVVLNNNKWSGIGENKEIGVDGIVNAIKVINNELLIGGIFTSTSDDTVQSLARWDEKKWSSIGGGLFSDNEEIVVFTLYPYQDGFFAAGLFNKAGNKDVSNIAWFDGTQWQSVGSGTNAPVTSLAIFNDELLAGGGFNVAGGKPSVSAGLYDLSITSVEEDKIQKMDFALFQNYPNPFNPISNFGFRISESGHVKIKVYDIIGREVAVLMDEEKSAGEYTISFDAKNLASGIYFYKITSGKYSQTKKMILAK